MQSLQSKSNEAAKTRLPSPRKKDASANSQSKNAFQIALEPPQNNGFLNALNTPIQLAAESNTSSSGTSPAPTPAPTPTFAACTSLPRQIFSRGACGAGTDFTHNDFQSLAGASSSEQTAVWEADNLTLDFQLRNRMRLELGLLAGSEGFRMVTHFTGGTGTTLTHDASSTLGSAALGSGAFTNLHNAVIQEIERQLASMHTAGAIDCNTLTLNPSAVPSVSFSFQDGFALKGIIGGTQGMEIKIVSLTIDPRTRTYTLELRYLICDDFGVDTADLYSPALVAFWVLQHRRSGNLPFINLLDLSKSQIGTY